MFTPNHITYRMQKETLQCRGKEGTDKQFCTGTFFGWVEVGGTNWAIVLWDGEDDPDLYKANMIEVAETKWETLF